MIRELFLHRDLLRELVRKDLKLRYRRPVLGFLWAFLSPLLLAGILYLVFSLIMKVEIKEAPFLLYLMSAVFPWRFFQDSLTASATSLLDNKNLIREANFPHYIICFAAVLACGINFLPSLGVIMLTGFFWLKGASIFVILLPLVLATHLILTLGLALIISVCYLKYRDIKYALEIALQMIFYLTPVFYSLSLIKDIFPRNLFYLYLANPFVGVLNLYRICLLKGFYPAIKNDAGGLVFLVWPVVFALMVFYWGIYLYQDKRKEINDYLSY